MIAVPEIPPAMVDIINEHSNDDKRLAALSMCFLWRLRAEEFLSDGDEMEAGKYLAAANRLQVMAKTAKKKQKKPARDEVEAA